MADIKAAAMNKAKRVEQIIERCARLQPPIEVDVLRKLPAFKSAKDIPWALMEIEWPILRGRLRAQAEVYEKNAKAAAVAPDPNDPLAAASYRAEMATQLGNAAEPVRKRPVSPASDTPSCGQPRQAKKIKASRHQMASPATSAEANSAAAVVAGGSAQSASVFATPAPDTTSQNARPIVQAPTINVQVESVTLVPYTSSPRELSVEQMPEVDTAPVAPLSQDPGHGSNESYLVESIEDGHKIEYLASKLEACGRLIMPISSCPMGMRAAIIVSRALREYNQRFGEDPPIGLILQTLHTANNLESLKAKHALGCALCDGKATSSGACGSPTSLVQSLILLVLHFDIQHGHREVKLAAMLQRHRTADFFKALIALPSHKDMELRFKVMQQDRFMKEGLLRVCMAALAGAPDHPNGMALARQDAVIEPGPTEETRAIDVQQAHDGRSPTPRNSAQKESTPAASHVTLRKDTSTPPQEKAANTQVPAVDHDSSPALPPTPAAVHTAAPTAHPTTASAIVSTSAPAAVPTAPPPAPAPAKTTTATSTPVVTSAAAVALQQHRVQAILPQQQQQPRAQTILPQQQPRFQTTIAPPQPSFNFNMPQMGQYNNPYVGSYQQPMLHPQMSMPNMMGYSPYVQTFMAFGAEQQQQTYGQYYPVGYTPNGNH